MPTSIDALIGQTLVFGIPGPRPTQRDIKLFRDTHAGGLILYRINFRSPTQIKQLIRDLEDALGRRLLVTVDHEGGRVVMFQSGVTVFPDNLAFGAMGKTAHARAQGTIEGRELRRLGMDVAFSPTVDVLTDAFSPNIGIRSYGRDPQVVSRLAAARIRALQREAVSACAKHFPGLGPATLDPHLDLPIIPVKWAELRRRHLIPFEAAIQAGVDMIMSSHPLYPHLDPTPKTPATFSHRLMTDLLRREMGFKGVVASDDLEMGALRSLTSVGQAAVLAARAGHDLILCCHKENLQRHVFQSLKEAYQNRELSVKNLEESVIRIEALRGRHGPRFSNGRPQADPAGKKLVRTVARKAVQVTTGQVNLPIKGAETSQNIPLPLGEDVPKVQVRGKAISPVLILFPRLSQMAKTIMVEPDLLDENKFLEDHVSSPGKRIHLLPLNPSASDIQRAAKHAATSVTTVFFCYDAHLQHGNRRLLERLQRTTPRLVLVLLRDPYDRSWAKKSTTVVTAFGYRQAQLEACLETIFS